VDLLRPKIQPYPWGTVDAIAELQGRPVPAPGPEAELWMGAHPSAPSALHRPSAPSDLHRAPSAPSDLHGPPSAPSDLHGPPSAPSDLHRSVSAPSDLHRAPSSPIPPATSASPVTLDTVITADPEGELGPEVAARFDGRLPFLLKVLSAAKALSIQVHPSRAQAEAGYAAENVRGLAPDDPARNYVDDWPKPELLYALTPFEVATGLRPPSDAATLLQALDVDELKPLAAGLTDPSADLGAALASILRWPEPARLVSEVVAACQRLAVSASPYAGACAAAVRVAADHPGDVGVVALLLMRHEVLQPGQAVFMPAGGLHAYLRGTGIELLANSDNVVRSGLTGKHVDVPELLKLLDPSVAVPVLTPRLAAPGITTFGTPAPEFRLYLIDLPAPASQPQASSPAAPASQPSASSAAAPAPPADAAPALALPGAGPRILLCLEGACSLRAASGQVLDLTRGGSCFIPFADGPVHATGRARLALATPGTAPL
jgi:mannose-6-phosphate isomerase